MVEPLWVLNTQSAPMLRVENPPFQFNTASLWQRKEPDSLGRRRETLIRDCKGRSRVSFETVTEWANTGYAARVYWWWSPPTRGSETILPLSARSTSRPCGGRCCRDW